MEDQNYCKACGFENGSYLQLYSNINLSKRVNNKIFDLDNIVSLPKDKSNENNFIFKNIDLVSLLVMLFLFIEIVTYLGLLILFKPSFGTAHEYKILEFIQFIPAIIICSITLTNFIILIKKNLSKFIFLNMITSWGPLVLIPIFVDLTWLKMAFSSSIIIKLLPLMSLFIVISINTKCLSYFFKNKRYKN